MPKRSNLVEEHKLISIDAFRDKFPSDRDAAAAMDADYNSFRRWIRREVFPREHSASRALARAAGVELPRREQ